MAIEDVLVHLALLSALTWIPKYIFKVPMVVDRSQIIDQHKDFTYLDSPKLPPKLTIKPVPVKPPVIDKETLEAMNRANPPAKAPEPAPPAPAPPQPAPTPSSQQSQVEAPHPAAVPARPNFAMNSLNPADQLNARMFLTGSRMSHDGMPRTFQIIPQADVSQADNKCFNFPAQTITPGALCFTVRLSSNNSLWLFTKSIISPHENSGFFG